MLKGTRESPWPRWFSSAATAAFGFGRERKSREAGPRGRVRGVRGGGVASPGVEEGGREAATAKQEVAGALRARATPRLCLLAEEEEDKGGRWAGPLLAAQCWAR